MEKRTIIAFALSFIVLIGWSFFFTPENNQAPIEEKSDNKTIEAQREKGTSLAPQMSDEQMAAPSTVNKTYREEAPKIISDKNIIVETPLYRVVFSNIGAGIKSFQLKSYRTSMEEGSPSIELSNMEQGSENYFQTVLGELPVGRDNELLYTTDKDNLILDPGSGSKELIFKAITRNGIEITQSFRFYPDTYPIELTVDLTNGSGHTIQETLKSVIKNTPPEEKRSYYAFTGLALVKDGKVEEMDPDDLEEAQEINGMIRWMGYEEDYFLSAIIPESDTKGRFNGKLFSSGIVRGIYTSAPFTMNPGGQFISNYKLYIGPRDLGIVKEVGSQLDKAINFGWTDIIAKPLLYILRFFNKYVNNYGVSIIILTILVKIIFWPLTHKSYKSMKEMQKLQPLMAKIREKHKDNKEQMNKELMGLYKTYKINPAGGCLPMLVQMPVFFALFRVLGSAIELRHAPFMLWIDDLSAPDRFFHFPFEIPFMAPPSGIPVLTLLMGASMILQQKMTPTPGDPAQAKMMMMLPVVFMVMFINFPSGLVLYWFVSNIISIGQQYRIKRGPA